MTEKLTPDNAFPSGIPVPETLQALVAAVNDGTLDSSELGGDFGLYFGPVGNKAAWFARPATPSALYAAEQLAEFGRSGDGSIYAIWKAPSGGFPVVYLDSEGDCYALAGSFDQFLQLLVADDREEDEAAADDFRAWVHGQGLDIPAISSDIIEAAALAYPDFYGWCEEAVEGTLSADPPVPLQPTNTVVEPVNDTSPDTDLWALALAAVGQRIDSPAVQALVGRIGARPLAPATPRNDRSSTVSRSFGIEISASCTVRHRAYWPRRKEGRLWDTYVTRITIEPPYPGPLPEGLDWAMSEAALDALGINEIRGALEIPYWVMPSPRDDLVIEATTSDTDTFARLLLSLPQERDHITASAHYEKEKPLVYVEDAFFAVWCALNGLLRPDKFTQAIIEPLRARQMTPLQFLHGPCERLLWSGDVAPDQRGFVSAYFDGVRVPDAQRWVTDVKTVFGASNHFRDAGDPMTEDRWENFDRIAPYIQRRYTQWRRGDLKAEWKG
ncbi:SMI1/KNR4 family protein [Burkholderia contaminans]|uniref:SMI1/KNR4 family protein n=1 Tax=Burkholderia contaminans TaxID=488447 RepID=UPI0008F52DED|nr:SMI1/KNR4 family protein [Burkholderia contaminans]